MGKTLEFASKFWLGEEGATVVEYVLMVMFVALVCFAAVSALGQALIGSFQRTVNGLS